MKRLGRQQTADRDIATKWGCSIRTARRWRALGINLTDDLALIRHIINTRSATTKMLAACQRNIKNKAREQCTPTKSKA